MDRVHLFQRGEAWWVYYLLDGRRVRKSLKTDNKKIAEGIRAELEFKLRRSELRHEQPLPPDEFIERFHEYQRPRKTKKSCPRLRRETRGKTAARMDEKLATRSGAATVCKTAWECGSFGRWERREKLGNAGNPRPTWISRARIHIRTTRTEFDAGSAH